MSNQEQLDKQALTELRDIAKKVAMGNAPPSDFLSPAFHYLARAPIPSGHLAVRSLGRISFGRDNAHRPGIILFVPEQDLNNSDRLREVNRQAALGVPTQKDYRSMTDGSWDSPDAAATFISNNVSLELDAAEQADVEYEGTIYNQLLPAVICALESIDDAYVRWRGPGSEGRVQIDEALEGQSGFAVWVHPDCLGPDLQPEDIARFCDADEGQPSIMEGIDL
ncbi:hypothetical protein [Natrinema salsiterrestre]|uniref:Uncharacterized protein n=1 Tax=Natrinema salsiterrestre TaxID=2950540 RepID=A0A9Q4L1Y3_9EURY|nr:hypothetical protein [Natrinema salsiterrestre]MDF9745032.1 hypothetical protein [Natrinema salsiterrestre]